MFKLIKASEISKNDTYIAAGQGKLFLIKTSKHHISNMGMFQGDAPQGELFL